MSNFHIAFSPEQREALKKHVEQINKNRIGAKYSMSSFVIEATMEKIDVGEVES